MSVLAILFIGLKLTYYVDWSWWLVLAPLWIPAALILILLLPLIITLIISALVLK